MKQRDGNEPETADQKYLWLRICSGALVVVLALAAVFFCLTEVLDNYKVTAPPPDGTDAAVGDSASVSASSVVAVLTPVMAAIVGIAGLFFGISATGSAKGRKAEAEEITAQSNAKSAEVNAAVLPETAEALKECSHALKESAEAVKDVATSQASARGRSFFR
jgi:hypothetical protein